ncbi:MAG: UDP-N-acetylenolpyruvoylglucosamine reductase [Devosia sp.]|uniref:UDP-N-acetylmuramate dehydrogenase n=1 Tax=Devosia sp. TaxID=1871048 RepID=UPI0026090079|nr:UDP-N-acetylmuramate dehydrogenase [Devosia sp.]MDB5527537.1 UDP-N-acetylenolpyruvoylglucosamine reductase [Devosia sp.]
MTTFSLIQGMDLTPANSFGLSASSRFGAIITSPDELAAAYEHARAHGLPVHVLGGGSNVILSPQFDGLTLLMALKGKTLIGQAGGHNIVEAAAGETWHDFVVWTLDNDLPGLENLALIPGTVGASPVQNIGAYGLELADRFDNLTAFDTQSQASRSFSAAECRFAYRQSVFKAEPGRYIVTSVRFALPTQWTPILNYAGLNTLPSDASPHAVMEQVIALRQSKLPDPKKIGNVGSFFHNPVVPSDIHVTVRAANPAAPAYPQPDGSMKLSAGWLIEQCGLKGAREGQVGVSERHALVLVNHGGGTRAEVEALAARIKAAVFERFGIGLTAEPVFY